MSYIAIVMPEQNEGKEAGIVCLVKDTNLETVKEVVFGKGYGVQGHDDGVVVFRCETLKYTNYIMPILNLDDFKNALIEGELSWYKVIEWQRWGWGYVNEENRTVVLNKEGVVISTYFGKCGYKIVTRLLPIYERRNFHMYTLKDLDDFVDKLALEEIISSDEIDYKWAWVAREICREQGVGLSEEALSEGIMKLSKNTTLGPKARAKLENFQKWANEQGSKASLIT